MTRDIFTGGRYASIMKDVTSHIIITIDTKDPIEIGDFVSVFSAISGQYEKYIKEKHPEYKGEAHIFVKQVSSGSVIADLIPIVLAFGAPASIEHALKIADVTTDFVLKYKAKLLPYLNGSGESEAVSSSDLKDFMGSVAAIANDPDGNSRIEAVYFNKGEKEVTAAIKFNTKEARIAAEGIESHRLRLQSSEHSLRERVLMIFTQSNIKDLPKEKRTGEKVLIEEIDSEERPLIYASDLAEKHIKHEIREEDDNVYKKGFVVDVMIETRRGRICAYKVFQLHQVIDLD
jgi:hypothetical protein